MLSHGGLRERGDIWIGRNGGRPGFVNIAVDVFYDGIGEKGPFRIGPPPLSLDDWPTVVFAPWSVEVATQQKGTSLTRFHSPQDGFERVDLDLAATYPRG